MEELRDRNDRLTQADQAAVTRKQTTWQCLSIGSAAAIAMLGQARGTYTFRSHLKWAWAIALGYAASIAAHLVLNAAFFSKPI